MDSITNLMLEEHEKINNLLLNLEENNELTSEKFLELKRELGLHFALEEKAIFYLYNKIRNNEVEEIFDLMQEHGDILIILKSIEQDLESKLKPNLNGLIELLSKHTNFENAVFYPKLDKDLNEEQKADMLNKINELKREF